MKSDHRIVLVEFSSNRPFSVVTMGPTGHYDHYDFEWSRREKCHFWHRSGGSFYLEHGSSTYWLADDFGSVRDGGGTLATGKRLTRMPRRWPLETLFGSGQEAEALWCSVCKDWLPWCEDGDVCAHVCWCEDCGWLTGAGYEDGCKCGKAVAR